MISVVQVHGVRRIAADDNVARATQGHAAEADVHDGVRRLS